MNGLCHMCISSILEQLSSKCQGTARTVSIVLAIIHYFRILALFASRILVTSNIRLLLVVGVGTVSNCICNIVAIVAGST